jgi:hypothetical protein
MALEVLEIPASKTANFSGEVVEMAEATYLIDYREPPEIILVFCDHEDQGLMLTCPVHEDEARCLETGTGQEKSEMLGGIVNYSPLTDHLSPGEMLTRNIVDKQGEPLTLVVRNLGSFTVSHRSN